MANQGWRSSPSERQHNLTLQRARWQGQALAPAVLASIGPSIGRAAKSAALGQCQNAKRQLGPLKRLRSFLDAQVPAARAFSEIGDDTQICRCEAISAGEIRRIAGFGCSGLNQARSLTRAGMSPCMGPCMGRQCGASVAKVLAVAQGKRQQALGYYAVRLPLKPVTLGDLCALEADAPAAP